ncbi:MAG: phosphodiester glycosidase family protein [Candidatus Avispirillum sp.]
MKRNELIESGAGNRPVSPPGGSPPPAGSGRKSKKSKKSKKPRLLAALIAVFISLTALYAVIVCSDIPFIDYWRTIWIETAMTTKSHQWLATLFFPQEVINSVMSNRYEEPEVVGGDINPKPTKPDNDKQNTEPEDTDLLKLSQYYVGGKDYVGNTIVINDIENGILVSEISGPNYKGRIMLVDEPSRVYVGMTQYPGVTGMRILDMMEYYGAVAGVNASGFADYDENGNGGQVVGMSLSQGKYWGSYVSYYSSIVLTEDDRLIVGTIGDWASYGNIRDGIQFSPLLIANGVKMVSGSSGYGIQPRTAVGQREDGVMVFLNVDGRDVTYSIGCTVDDMAEILLSYGVVNASSCDSGATSVIAYKGEVITRNCSANPTLGRILPNAFLINPKEKSAD